MNKKDYKLFNNSILRLSEILQKENNFLREFKIEEMNNLQEEKNNILNDFVDFIKIINDEKTDITDEMKNTLISNFDHLNRIVAENQELVAKALYINEKLVDIIKNQLSENISQNLGYNNNGIFGNICNMPSISSDNLV